MNDRIQALLDKSDLQDLVNTYARGLDRCDPELLKSVFFEDATVEMISFSGEAHAFTETTLAALKVHAATTSHFTTNCLFEIDGDHAVGESYLISVSVMKDGDDAKPAVHVGRYLDRFQKRNGQWKFIYRSIVIDLEASGEFPPSLHTQIPIGDEKRYPDDRSYALRHWLQTAHH